MSLRWRVTLVALSVALFGYYAVANVASEETRLESPLIPDASLRLGLDLRGGIHWVTTIENYVINSIDGDAHLAVPIICVDKMPDGVCTL